MLSRAAERMYWIGRHIERAENTARLINVNSSMIMDLPLKSRQLWGSLIDITGANTAYYEKYTRPEERHVMRFILADESNPVSLLATIGMARENARISREIMPTESWERINEFYLYAKKNRDKGIKRDGRHKYLSDVIMYCNQITGLLFGCMSHGNAYSFVRAGRNLERADMCTRIIDVGCLNLLGPGDDMSDAFNDLLWMNVLRSLSAYQMYRQYVKDRVNGEDVVDFLLKDSDFPRSVAHCINELNTCFERLPGNDLPLRSSTHTLRLIHEADVGKLMKAGLHEFIDDIQLDIFELHTQVGQSWFGHQADGAASSSAG